MINIWVWNISSEAEYTFLPVSESCIIIVFVAADAAVVACVVFEAKKPGEDAVMIALLLMSSEEPRGGCGSTIWYLRRFSLITVSWPLTHSFNRSTTWLCDIWRKSTPFISSSMSFSRNRTQRSLSKICFT